MIHRSVLSRPVLRCWRGEFFLVAQQLSRHAGRHSYRRENSESVRGRRSGHGTGLIANQSPGTAGRLAAYSIAHDFDLVLASAEVGMDSTWV